MTQEKEIRAAILRTADRIQKDAIRTGRPMPRGAAVEKARLVALKFFKNQMGVT